MSQVIIKIFSTRLILSHFLRFLYFILGSGKRSHSIIVQKEKQNCYFDPSNGKRVVILTKVLPKGLKSKEDRICCNDKVMFILFSVSISSTQILSFIRTIKELVLLVWWPTLLILMGINLTPYFTFRQSILALPMFITKSICLRTNCCVKEIFNKWAVDLGAIKEDKVVFYKSQLS